jgi:streptogramin lyase
VDPTSGEIEISRPEEGDAGLAQVAFTFGRQGIGPGQFTDARYIGVDGAGNVYVAEHTEGSRVQVFEPAGQFVSLWTPDNTDAYVVSLDAGRQGTVYLVQQGEIDRYDGLTGEFLGKVTRPRIGGGFDDVVATPDGGFVAAGSRILSRYSSDAELLWSVDEPIESQTGDSELSPHVAVDGLGHIYVLGSFHNAVFKFSPEGKFLDQFGGDGDGPGQFRAPDSIAVDGQGRVYVGDIKGVQVFDSSGRYIGLIEVDGVPFGLAFNDDDELFVAAREQVIKYVLDE